LIQRVNGRHREAEWPFGTDYEEPEPIRICYPNVMLKDRAVYFCGVSDIIEPKKEWRKFKRELTGKEWDYDFRDSSLPGAIILRKGNFIHGRDSKP